MEVPAAEAARIDFVPAGPAFTVEVVDAGAGGTLRVVAAEGAEASARALGAAEAAELLVLPSGVRIRDAGEGAAYEVAVPAGVTRVTVRVGDAPPVVLRPADLPREIPIGPALP